MEHDTSVAGQLVPRAETGIEVQEEHLAIRFEKQLRDGERGRAGEIASRIGIPTMDPLRVSVAARYVLRNPAEREHELELAFPIFRSGPEESLKTVRFLWHRWQNQSLSEAMQRGVRCKVRLNDEPLPFEYVPFESLFEKERTKWASAVRQWLEQWPELLEILEGPPDEQQISQPIQYADPPFPAPQLILRPGLPNTDSDFLRILKKIEPQIRAEPRECPPPKPAPHRQLLIMMAGQARHFRTIDEWDLDFLSFASSFIRPEAEDSVARYLDMWGCDEGYLKGTGEMLPGDSFDDVERIQWSYARLNRRIDFLIYRVTLGAGESSVVEVEYSHLADVKVFHARDDEYRFQYILRTSNKWKSFGPVHLTLSLPPDRPYAISLPVDSRGRKDNCDHYSFIIPRGSELTENLHVGYGLQGAREFKDDVYPAQIHLRSFWERYRANPAGPFAPSYLKCMAQKVRAGAVRSEGDYAFWGDTLEIDSCDTEDTELDEKIAERLLAMAAAKPPEVAKQNRRH